MFTKFPHEFWDLLDSTAEIVVLLRILKNIGFSQDGVSFESQQSMCQACFITKPTLRKVLESLAEKKIIIVDEGANRPHKITLHENVAGEKIGLRNRIYLYRGINFTPAKKGSNNDSHSEGYTLAEPFQVVRKRVEALQDARNAIPSKKNKLDENDEQ